MAEAVEAPSAMDGWPSADSVEKLFSFSGAFVRAAVTIDHHAHATAVRRNRIYRMVISDRNI